jgi:hypothetical protein
LHPWRKKKDWNIIQSSFRLPLNSDGSVIMGFLGQGLYDKKQTLPDKPYTLTL